MTTIEAGNPEATYADAIVESIDIEAPVARVWRALTDVAEFGAWFGAEINGPFRPGETVSAQMQSGCGTMALELTVVEMAAPRRFVFSWHPYAVDPAVDYSGERQTTVEFLLVARDTGTHLTVRESGFNAIPSGRRMEAFSMNTKGWRFQLANIERYVSERT